MQQGISEPYINAAGISLLKEFVTGFHQGITVTCPGFYAGRVLDGIKSATMTGFPVLALANTESVILKWKHLPFMEWVRSWGIIVYH
jgi:hypothetical protein